MNVPPALGATVTLVGSGFGRVQSPLTVDRGSSAWGRNVSWLSDSSLLVMVPPLATTSNAVCRSIVAVMMRVMDCSSQLVVDLYYLGGRALGTTYVCYDTPRISAVSSAHSHWQGTTISIYGELCSLDLCRGKPTSIVGEHFGPNSTNAANSTLAVGQTRVSGG